MELDKMTLDDWKKQAEKYGFELDLTKKQGFYIDDHELTMEEIFPELLEFKDIDEK
ncbi:MAG: hypothetical protein K0Q49_2475 [Haloplasmataceae bacterium]|jgi:hypothetical protein|nr:hypothetical protein [Haloplasmataceae bacterium]